MSRSSVLVAALSCCARLPLLVMLPFALRSSACKTASAAEVLGVFSTSWHWAPASQMAWTRDRAAGGVLPLSGVRLTTAFLGFSADTVTSLSVPGRWTGHDGVKPSHAGPVPGIPGASPPPYAAAVLFFPGASFFFPIVAARPDRG